MQKMGWCIKVKVLDKVVVFSILKFDLLFEYLLIKRM